MGSQRKQLTDNMKKISYLLLGIAGITLASCSNEEKPQAPVEEANYTVTVQLPENYLTRAATSFGTGYEANQLYFAVYDASTGAYVENGQTTFNPTLLSAKVGFYFAKGKSYKIAFFAQSEASNTEGVYTFNYAGKVIDIDYSKMNSVSNLNDAYDCFYGLLVTGEIGTSNVQVSKELNRPVAQVNWGTSDLGYNATSHDEAYGNEGQYIVSNLSATAYKQFDFFTSDVVETSKATVNINSFAAPYKLTFPVTMTDPAQEYVYVDMVYLFAPQGAGMANLDLTITNAGNTDVETISSVVPVSNAPIQANFMTNIYGALLTDNVDITVTKVPGWSGSEGIPY